MRCWYWNGREGSCLHGEACSFAHTGHLKARAILKPMIRDYIHSHVISQEFYERAGI